MSKAIRISEDIPTGSETMSRVVFRGVNITSEDILSAAATFDQLYADSIVYDAGSGHKQSSYVVQIAGRDYPSMAILALATRLPSHTIVTDDTTRHVFTLLGFAITEPTMPRRHEAPPPKELAERRSSERLLETSNWIEQNHDSWLPMLDTFREASRDVKNVSVQTGNDNPSDVISSVSIKYQLLETLGLPADIKDALRSVGIRILMDLVESRDDHLLLALDSEQLADVRAKQAEWLLLLAQPGKRLQVADGATPLTELGLSVRPYNALVRRNILTIEQLVALSPQEIFDVRNLGTKSLDEILDRLAEHPLRFEFSPSLPEASAAELLLHVPVEQVDEPVLEPDGQETPLLALDLPVRAHNALARNDIRTVGQLAIMSDEDLFAVRNLGTKSLNEIRQRLTVYLEDHPLQPLRDDCTTAYRAPGIRLAKTTLPILESELLLGAEHIPLQEFPLSRLGLSPDTEQKLRNAGIQSIFGLSEITGTDFEDSTFIEVQERTRHYLTWLLAQDRDAWEAEIANRGISPLYRFDIERASVDELVTEWLSFLSDRHQLMLRLRFGLEGRIWTLEEIGQEMGLTRERIRQIEKQTLRALGTSTRRQTLMPIAAIVKQTLEDHAGVMRPRMLTAFIQRTYGAKIVDLNPIGLYRLVAQVYGEIVVAERQRIVYLTSCSPDTIHAVQMEMVRILDNRATPLSTRALLKQFKQTTLYEEHIEELTDAFITACLRSSSRIERDDRKLHALRKASWKRKSTVIKVMREIGEPAHFSVITQHFNLTAPVNRQLSEHNLHAYLGRFPDQFVRVGHGVYGLTEWGLRNDGKVANTAYKVLQDARRPFHIDALTQEVLKNWHVNPGSVLAAVETDDRFIRIGRGVYALTEYVSGETNPDKQFDFGDVFGDKLVRWQREVDQREPSTGFDAQSEVESVRSLGVEFFSD